MERQNQSEELFRTQLLALMETAKKQGMTVTQEQVASAFTDMELSDSKLELIYDYLKNSKISVGEDAAVPDCLTEEDKNYLEDYMRELAALPVYTDREKEQIVIEAFGGSVSAKEKLLHLFLPKVVEISRLYTGQGVLVQDLIGEGNVAAAMAMEMFDCIERPDEVEGFLSKMIMDAMEKSAYEELSQSRKEEELVGRINKIAEAAEQLAEDLRRPVSAEELERETEFTKEEIREALAATGYKIKDI
ncbi:MAG: hypothetical protein IJ711_01725, partial [Lachnospiraceae bacterium]|nr:hypothetical protein [Lachnospiraceae bacterium]